MQKVIDAHSVVTLMRVRATKFEILPRNRSLPPGIWCLTNEFVYKFPSTQSFPSLSTSSISQVLIPDIPPPSNPPEFPHTPTSSNLNFDSQSASPPSSSSTKHSKRHLVVNIPLHPMSVPTDVSPTDNPIPGCIPPIHSSEASSPSASSVLKISTGQHAEARPFNPPDHYGDWHNSFTATVGTFASSTKNVRRSYQFCSS